MIKIKIEIYIIINIKYNINNNMTKSRFWSFDWLFGIMKINLGGDDLYGPQDGQFMAFGSYPHSRSRNRVLSSYELNNKRQISPEEKQARIDGLMRVAQGNYEIEEYKNKTYGTTSYKKKVYPY